MSREMNELINKIICGSVPKALKQLPQGSIDCVVTSPPYWALRDYGVEPQIWDGDEKCEHEWETRTYQIGNRAGNKDRNQPFFTQRHNVNEQYKASMPTADFCIKCQAWRGSLGLEPIFDLYIKHLAGIFDEVKRILRKDGTCWVNLGDTYSGGGNTNDRFQKQGRSKSVGEYKFNYKLNRIQEKCLCLIPFRFAIEMVNRGWILRNTIIWYKRNCMPSSIKDRFTVDFEYVFFFVKSKKYWFEQIFDPLKESSHQRLNYKFNKNKGDIASAVKTSGIRRFQERYFNKEVQGRNKRCVWDITTKPFKEAHFAVFPETLVEPMIKAGCPGKGMVLDPFCGSGTTLLMAKKLGRNYIGIDINPEYVKMSKRRIAGYLADCKIRKGEKP